MELNAGNTYRSFILFHRSSVAHALSLSWLILYIANSSFHFHHVHLVLFYVHLFYYGTATFHYLLYVRVLFSLFCLLSFRPLSASPALLSPPLASAVLALAASPSHLLVTSPHTLPLSDSLFLCVFISSLSIRSFFSLFPHPTVRSFLPSASRSVPAPSPSPLSQISLLVVYSFVGF